MEGGYSNYVSNTCRKHVLFCFLYISQRIYVGIFFSFFSHIFEDFYTDNFCPFLSNAFQKFQKKYFLKC
jgi:hypothetical protein